MKATGFTVSPDQQKQCRDWLRCRPSAEERKGMEARTKATFSADATRAEILIAAFAFRADSDKEIAQFLPVLTDFLQWLTEVDEEPEPEDTPEEPEEKNEDDFFVEKMCDIIDALREENEELRARLKELDP